MNIRKSSTLFGVIYDIGTPLACGEVTTSDSLVNCTFASEVKLTSNLAKANVTIIEATCLTAVTGPFEIISHTNNNALTAILLPSLTYVADFIEVIADNGNNVVLSALDMHSLAFAGQSLQISSNTALASLNFDLLTHVGQFFQVTNNNALSSLTLPVLSRVGQFFDVSNNNCTLLDLAMLTSVCLHLVFHLVMSCHEPQASRRLPNIFKWTPMKGSPRSMLSHCSTLDGILV